MAGYCIPGEAEEAALLAACRHDREAAAKIVYEVYGDALQAFCARRLSDRQDVEDAVQETALRATVAFHAVAAESRMWSWLATIAANVCADIERQAKRRRKLATPSRDVVPPPDDIVAERIRAELLMQAIDGLPEPLRTPLVLREFLSFSYAEIAQYVGRSVPWVKTTLLRTRRSLPVRVAEVARRTRRWPPAIAVPWLGGTLRGRFRSLRWSAARQRVRLAAFIDRNSSISVASACIPLLASIALSAPTLSAAEPRAAFGTDATTTTERPAVAPLQPELPAVVGNRQRDGGNLSKSVGLPDGGSDEAVAEHSLPAQPSLLPMLPGDEPERTWFTSIVASPAYEHDGVVFAVGRSCDGWCRLLFKSSNRGVTWERLSAVGLAGEKLVLPPDYPADGRLFAGGGSVGATLQVSEDGGESFRTIGPGTGTPVMSPGFSAGDARIFVPDAPGWEYDDRTKLVTPMALSLPNTAASTSRSLAVFPSPDDTVLVGDVVHASAESLAYVCTRQACRQSTLPPGGTGGPRFVVDRRFGTRVLAWTWRWLAASDDFGATFRRTPLTAHGLIDVAVDPRGRLYALVSAGHDALVERRSIRVSTDGGTTWEQDIRLPVNARFTDRLAVLPDGRLIGALAGGGLLCSLDDGATWTPRCRA